jgi:hypothetical protein
MDQRVPVHCPACGGVAFFIDRVHDPLDAFDVRQIERVDGSTPVPLDTSTACGACGFALLTVHVQSMIGVAHEAARLTSRYG